MSRERRLKTAWLPEHFVRLLLGDWRKYTHLSLPVLQGPGVPGDYQVDGVTYCWQRQAFGVRLYHPSFGVVPDGEEAPSFYPGDVAFAPVEVAVPQVKKLAPKPGDVLVVRAAGADAESMSRALDHAGQLARAVRRACGADVLTVVLGPGQGLECFDEAEMRRCGWVRAADESAVVVEGQ